MASHPKQVVFYIEGKGTLTPRELGHGCVRWAIEGAMSAMKGPQGIDHQQGTLCKLISANPLPAQLLMVAMKIAAYYVYVLRFLSSPKNVLDDMCSGISSGFSQLHATTNTSISAQLLDQRYRAYAQLIYDEVNAAPVDEGFNSLLKFASTRQLNADGVRYAWS